MEAASTIDATLPIEERNAREVENAAARVRIGKRVVKAAGVLVLSGFGLMIGTVLGIIAALMTGLIAIC